LNIAELNWNKPDKSHLIWTWPKPNKK